jgi:outer membrane lipoprotein-sorting protein
MRRVLLVSVVLMVAIFAAAQQDEKAKEILDKVSEKTRSYSTISADFSFSMQNAEMEIDEKNEGSIKLKGQKYSVDLPDVNGGIKVFSDGTTLWNYMTNGNQVTISNVEDEGSELMDPSAIFSIYEKGFDSKFVSEKIVGNKTLYQIDLFPDTEEHEVSKISVSINKATMMIDSAILYGTDDNLYVIEVKKMEPNKDLSDSEFVFDANKFDDVEIIDFR